MNTIAAVSAVVTGARHLRSARNGQDAAVTCVDDACAVAVVCDGCSSGGSSEVGARLGASLFARALQARLTRGECVTTEATWEGARGDVVSTLAALVERMPGDRRDAIREQFLFTVVGAALTTEGAAVWALGDGAYSFGEETSVLGPFDDNAPPYLAYDLLGEAQRAVFVTEPRGQTIIIATDGASELADGLAPLAADRFVTHPDALRRHLALLARGNERIDWTESRLVRTAATLQDDCAIAILRRAR